MKILAFVHSFACAKFGVKIDVFIHVNLPLESLHLLKKPHQNPLRDFKDLSIHRDRQRKAETLFYTILCEVQNFNVTVLSCFAQK